MKKLFVDLDYIPGQVFGLGIRNKRHAKRRIPWENFEMLLNGVKMQLMMRYRKGGFKGVRYVWFYFEFGKKKPGKIGHAIKMLSKESK